PSGAENIISPFEMNKTGPCLSEDTEPLKSLAGLHSKEALDLSTAIEVAVARKEIAFGFQREIFRDVVSKPAAKTIIGFPSRRGDGDRARSCECLGRNPKRRKLSADFKLLFIRLCANSGRDKHKQTNCGDRKDFDLEHN